MIDVILLKAIAAHLKIPHKNAESKQLRLAMDKLKTIDAYGFVFELNYIGTRESHSLINNLKIGVVFIRKRKDWQGR